MEANTTSSSSSPESALLLLLRDLISRGWCFRDNDRMKALITTQLSQHGTRCSVDSIESELLNMDLRSIGGKCLPEPPLLRKTSHIQGPIVLQVCSSVDISRSRITDASGDSGSKRLLRLKLTDGHSVVTAVEYKKVSSIPEEVIPGTKIRLQNKVDVCSGILCLNNNIVNMLGGVIQSLYEEWQMERKYLDSSRVPLRLSHENGSGPPPFEKFQIRAPLRETASVLRTSSTKGTYSSDTRGCSVSATNDSRHNLAEKRENSHSGQTARFQSCDPIMDTATDDAKLLHDGDYNKEKPNRSSTRPKVTASAPVQNQVAAQKLFQKTSQPNYNNRNSRNLRHRGKTKVEEVPVITLDEWERMKAGGNNSKTHGQSDINQDEDLARQLQEQFDLEDITAQKGSPHVMEAKSIEMSMFNYGRDDARLGDGTEFRGRGRGRGQGRGRGRGRGRVRG